MPVGFLDGRADLSYRQKLRQAAGRDQKLEYNLNHSVNVWTYLRSRLNMDYLLEDGTR